MSIVDTLKRISSKKYYVNIPAELINYLILDIGKSLSSTWVFLYKESYWDEGILEISYTNLANQLGISRKTAINEIKILTEKNYLIKLSNETRCTQNTYEVTLPEHAIENMKSTADKRPPVDNFSPTGVKFTPNWCKNYTSHFIYNINNINYRDDCSKFEQLCGYLPVCDEFGMIDISALSPEAPGVNRVSKTVEHLKSVPVENDNQDSSFPSREDKPLEPIGAPLSKEIEIFVCSLGSEINALELLSEATYAISNRFTNQTQRHAFNTFKKLVREGRWRTPYELRKKGPR